MLRKASKVAALFLSLSLTAGAFVGCTKGQNTGDTKSASTSSAAAATTAAKENGAVYPLKNSPKLTYWMVMHTNWTGYAKNFGELEIAKELEKKTGVKVEYIHPALGQEKEVFNILVASGDYPDIIEYKWTDFPGGPNTALNNGVIIKLNEAIEKYSPNLKKYLKDHPTYDKEAKMDDGTYYFYPFLRDGKELTNTAGPIIRKDWLNELSLAVPETVDDWYNMLKAFKDKKNASIPLTTVGDKNGIQIVYIFEGAFAAKPDFYIDNGKIKYGYMDTGYKEMLAFFNKLYKEGLMDKNFATTDKKAQDSNMLNGKSGATYGNGGSNIGVWTSTMKDKDPKFALTAAKYPVLKKGDKIKHGNSSTGMDRNTQAAITTKCKNIEAAARFLDYGYSQEGHLLYNFGTEGVSYKMVNNVPTYTDEVMKNPNKMTVAQAIAKYSRGNMSGPFSQDPQYILQFYELPEQKEALKLWSEHEKASTLVPSITPSDSESSELAKIMNDVETYVREMQLKFIMGTVSLSDYDKYVDQLKKMNVEKAIAIKQAALDRFNKR